MVKHLAVLGGGISGLALVHFLKKRFGERAAITLYERNPACGGNIQSIAQDGFLFECGPSGFIPNDLTLQLIQDIGLTDQLIQVASGLKRFIQWEGRLYEVPDNPLGFVHTPLVSPADKLAILRGVLNKNISKDQSVYDYAVKRFGVNAAEKFFDPLFSGIYAGDIKRLHMASVASKLKRSSKGARMLTLKLGLGHFIQQLQRTHRANIKCGTAIESLDAIKADHIFCALPSHNAAQLLKPSAPSLAEALEGIVYAPMAVVGLCFPRTALKKPAEGLGYLVPSSQGKDVLGVLVESNMYKWRAREGFYMFRVMMGGRHHPRILNASDEMLVQKAVAEIDHVYGVSSPPAQHWFKAWPYAIPQYEMNYPHTRGQVYREMNTMPHLTLIGNYLDGIAFNDCINNAHKIAHAAHF